MGRLRPSALRLQARLGYSLMALGRLLEVPRPAPRGQSQPALTWGEIEPEKLNLVRGEDSLLIDGDPGGHHATRCRKCFSLLYWTGHEGKIRVPYGSLVDAPTLQPIAHMFVGSKASWYEICDDLPVRGHEILPVGARRSPAQGRRERGAEVRAGRPDRRRSRGLGQVRCGVRQERDRRAPASRAFSHLVLGAVAIRCALEGSLRPRPVRGCG
jgi:hypothetical protein